VVVLDVPIGLSHAARACDVAARKLLRHRHVCVFTPPCREALAASSYEEAIAANRRYCAGLAITIQAFNIPERIRAVDDLITPGNHEYIREAHPEVVFATLNRALPSTHGKDTPEGIAERMALLAAAGVPSFDPVAERKRLGAGAVDVDDIVDAAAMLLTAKHLAEGTAAHLPLGVNERDERGLAMEMWVRAGQPAGVTISKSGVRLSDDFRDNLIIDCYHPELATMRGSNRNRFRSEHSEDALTWNVFRSLAQVDPAFWLPLLHRKALPDAPLVPSPRIVTLHLWRTIEAPPALRLHQRDEGLSEIDVVIETEFSVWFIEPNSTATSVHEQPTMRHGTRPDRPESRRRLVVRRRAGFLLCPFDHG